MKNIAIIPARGGSKGIIRKNLRFFNYQPLIYYVIQNALNCEKIHDVVVTSESDEIIEYCRRFDIKIRKRPAFLSGDETTLDPVIYDTVVWFENEFYNVDNIITLQPTSPLLTVRTLSEAIDKFETSELDTLISVEDDTNLGWIEKDGTLVENYEKRVNRQWLTKKYKETGAFLISKRSVINENTRIGQKIGVYAVPKYESLDIDDEIDWNIAENLSKRLKILFVTSANPEIGMGHIHRCITLANNFIGHTRDFLVFNTFDRGKSLLKENNYSYIEVNDITQIGLYIDRYDIIINDFLDTSNDYMGILSNKFAVNFEDLGEGADKANIVFNALYELSNPKENHRFGWKYFILDDKILIKTPNAFNEEVRQILITFGGIDQNNLTLKTLRALESLNHSNIKIKVILGPGYAHKKDLDNFLENSNLDCRVLSEVKDMGKEMQNIDLAITSNGRTVYELAAMNIPTISISQNDRETMHLFSRYSKGVSYLGISCNVDEDFLSYRIRELIENKEKRYKMYKSLSNTNIRKGIKRVKDDIINSYWRWWDERNNNW